LDWCFQVFPVEAHVRFDLVVPVDIFGDRGNLGSKTENEA
jgi:hypothetical protein